MSIFSAPKIDVPKEDPAVTAARVQAQNQADNTLTMSIQDDLRRRMQSRVQSFGLSPAAASATSGPRPSVTSGFMGPV